jgi:hypothetical protein
MGYGMHTSRIWVRKYQNRLAFDSFWNPRLGFPEMFGTALGGILRCVHAVGAKRGEVLIRCTAASASGTHLTRSLRSRPPQAGGEGFDRLRPSHRNLL